MGKKKKVKKEEIIDLNADNQNLKKILPKGKQEIKSTFNEDMKFNDDLLNDGMKEFDFDQDEEEIKDDKKEKLTSEIRELKKLLDQKRKEMLEYIGVE